MKEGNRNPALAVRRMKAWGVGQRLAAGMSGGPLQAEFVGQVLEDELGPMKGQFTAKGADAGLQGAKVHW